MNDNKETFFNKKFYKAFITLILAFIVLFFAMVLPLISYHLVNHSTSNWIQGLLTSLILFIFGIPYIKAVWIFFKTNCISIRLLVLSLVGIGLTGFIFWQTLAQLRRLALANRQVRSLA